MPAWEGAAAAAEPRSTKTEVIGVKELAAPEAEPRLQLLLAEGSESREEGKGELGAGANYCRAEWEEEEEGDGDVSGGEGRGEDEARGSSLIMQSLNILGGKGSTGIVEASSWECVVGPVAIGQR